MAIKHPGREPTVPKEYDSDWFSETFHWLWLWMHAAGQPNVDAVAATAVRSTTATAVTVGAADGLIIVDTTAGNVTVTLPAPDTVPGRQFAVKRKTAGANTLTVVGASGNIDTIATKLMPTQFDAFRFKSDGTDYWLV